MSLAGRILDTLPQTQCMRCGYPDCAAYAQAIADGQAGIDRCPPGGAEGIARLAAVTGQPVVPLAADVEPEGPMTVAVIDEAWCIGCTLCIKACPTDAILGGNKRMHTVIEPHCTGCALCIPVCPVDCIQMQPTGDTGATGWAAWSQSLASHARARYEARQQRLALESTEHAERLERKAQAKLADLPALTRGASGEELDRKRRVIEQALARARARRAQG